jgi:hypothetical protein
MWDLRGVSCKESVADGAAAYEIRHPLRVRFKWRSRLFRIRRRFRMVLRLDWDMFPLLLLSMVPKFCVYRMITQSEAVYKGDRR